MSAPAAVLAAPAAGLYTGRRVALLTQHGKEALLAPVLDAALGCRIERVSGYDTDRLGTFTREVPRAGSQLEAARRKARIGMELSGLPIGLASEGAFGVDTTFGVLPWNVELLVWIDDERGIEVVGQAQAVARHATRRVRERAEAHEFARQCGFPEHGLVLRPSSAHDPRHRKDLADSAALDAAFDWAMGESPDGFVALEVDVRAHRNPTRQAVIRRAAQDLAARLASPCPACAAPGFALARRERGLPCCDCGTPTGEVRADVDACVRCAHEVLRPRATGGADPAHCPACNP